MCFSNITQVIKEWWDGQCMWHSWEPRERERLVCGIFVGKPKGKRPLEKLGIHGRVILKPVLKK